jgi:hypothetical protein
MCKGLKRGSIKETPMAGYRAIGAWLALSLAWAFLGQPAEGQQSGVDLEATGSGASLELNADALDTALAITNLGTETATDVRVVSIDLNGYSPIGPLPLAGLPEDLGPIAPGATVELYANFPGSLASDSDLVLTVELSYTDPSDAGERTIRQHITPFMGGRIHVTKPKTIEPGKAGTFPPKTTGAPPADVNETSPYVIQRSQAQCPKPTQSAQTKVGTWQMAEMAGATIKPVARVDFTGTAKGDMGANGRPGWPREPSGAVSPKTTDPARDAVAFGTTNTNALFLIGDPAAANPKVVEVNPTTLFPQSDGGLCCDQIVQYVPTPIDRFIWLLQYKGAGGVNRMRIAAASPDAIIKTMGNKPPLMGAWTYWDVTCATLGYVACDLDYPDLAVGDSFLYASFDVNKTVPLAFPGLTVVRIKLTEIMKGGALPSLSAIGPTPWAFFGHVSQRTGDTAFWAGQLTNCSMALFSWPEAPAMMPSGTAVQIDAWPLPFVNNAPIPPPNLSGLAAKTLDDRDWLTAARERRFLAVIGLTRNQDKAKGTDELWLAWHSPAGTIPNGNNPIIFPQAQIQLVKLDLTKTPPAVTQNQIWNKNFAFAFPALTTDTAGSIAISLETGGAVKAVKEPTPTPYENHAVGFWGDFQVYTPPTSNTGTLRFGDYVTIRPDFAGGLAAFGYGLNKAVPGQYPNIWYTDFTHP